MILVRIRHRVDLQELYNFAVWVAASPPQFKDEVVKATEKFLKSHIVKLKLDEPTL